MPFSARVNRFKAKSAVESPWIDPWAWTWAETRQWDMTNANWDELEAREPDIGLFWQAADLRDDSNLETANSIWRSLAEKGSARSMVAMGLSYEFGRGVPIDFVQAEFWYERALAGSSTYAMVKCAEFALKRREHSECAAILRPGVDLGLASPQFWQAFCEFNKSEDNQTFTSIFPLLRSSARQGHPGANSYLTNFMVRGKFGRIWVPVGLVRATRLAVKKTNEYRPRDQGMPQIGPG